MCTFFKFVREEFMGFKQLMAKVQTCEDSWIREKQAVEKLK